jgi:hypothetical protein
MRFLTPSEWQAWCSERQVPLRESGRIRPDISAEHFHFVRLQFPADSGKKVSLARRLHHLVASGPETLLLVDNWDVWPSSQHTPLFLRFREALGERRPLIEAPGHLITPADTDDAVSIIATSLLFFWDCYGFSSTGRDAFFISHDGFCSFASRDPAIAVAVSQQ